MALQPCPSLPVVGPHNVVVIVADDVGVDMVGAYDQFYAAHGHPPAGYPNTTPTLDYLAQTGMLFRHAWTNPVCSPTRAQIMTGRHGLHTGVGKIATRSCPPGNGTGLQYGIDTIPSMLRDPAAPFATHTAAVGKWHLADGCQHPPPNPLDPIHPLGGGMTQWFHQYAGSIGNLGGTQTYNNWTKTFATQIQGPPADECVPGMGASYCEQQVLTYATEDTADDAIHLVRTMPEPFFLYVAFNAAHTPLDAPGAPLQAASCAGINGNPDCGLTPNDTPRFVRCMVQWMDNEIGRLVCAIENGSDAPASPTTIIFIGDNGTTKHASLPPFPSPGKNKGTVYQGGVHVPLIVKSPVIAPAQTGTVALPIVCSTDLFATVADLTGAPQPPDPAGLRESVSLAPYLLGCTVPMRQFVYAENFKNNFAPTAFGTPPPGYTLDKHNRAIRDNGGLKLVEKVKKSGALITAVEELYDLALDPFESNNIIAQKGTPAYNGRYTALRAELDTTYPHLVQ